MSTRYAEVLVPKADCLPKKTEMFSAIAEKDTETFSLYWAPSMEGNDKCGQSAEIDSYTIYWCQKTNGDRCKVLSKEVNEYNNKNNT